jgi:putative FmdB family regulatory protein
MPTYDYRCAKCGEDLEVYQTFSEEPLKKHAICGGKLTKVFSPVGIVLKGSGFYRNDKRDSGAARGKQRDEASTNGDSKSSSVGSESGSSESGSSDSRGSDSSKPAPASEKKNGEKKSSERKSDGKKSPVKSG